MWRVFLPDLPIPRGHLTGYRHPPGESTYLTISTLRYRDRH
jgi:hypothetical protein